jgi:hypothetical protein
LPPAPKVTTSGPKTVETIKSKVQIKGSVNGTADSLRYRVEKGSWKTVPYNGSGKWKLSVSVRKGKNKISVVALGAGGKSPPLQITATRK